MQRKILCIMAAVMLLLSITGCGNDTGSANDQTEDPEAVAEANAYTDNFIFNITNSTGKTIDAATVTLVVNGNKMQKEVIEDGIEKDGTYSIIMVPELSGFKVSADDEVSVIFAAKKNDEETYTVQSDVLSKEDHDIGSAYEFSADIGKDDSGEYIITIS